MDNFEDLKEFILHYVRGVWKNRWIAILIAWPIMIGGILAVDQIKDRYTAETKVFIDTSSVLRPLLKGLAVQTDFQSNVRLMVRKLLSRPNLERAARQLDLDIDINSSLEMEKLIEKIKSRVDITTRDRSGTYTITYTDESPRFAKSMVQTLLDIFVEDSLGKSVKESDSAISFLDKQIDKYDELLGKAEERLENFKRENVGLMPKDGVNFYSKLENISTLLDESRLQLSEAKNRRNKLKSQMENLVFEDVVVETSSNYDSRINEMEAKLEDLLLRYTDEHPDVIHTRKIIETLKKRRDEEISQNAQMPLTNTSNNPVAQQLQILLSETEATISSLTARVLSYEQKKKELKEMVDIIPRIEAELKKLNRDYEVHRANYNQLVERREQAKISEDVESGTEQVKFRLIEPPHVPRVASFPNRPLFDFGVLLFSLVIGYGFGLLLSLAQPVFYNPSELKNYTGFAVLGSVEKFDTNEVLAKRKRNLFYFGLANISLLFAASVLIYLHSKGVLILSSLQIMVMGL